MAKNPVGHRHIDIKHFIRDPVQAGTINYLTYCLATDVMADIFTKPLPRAQLEKLRN